LTGASSSRREVLRAGAGLGLLTGLTAVGCGALGMGRKQTPQPFEISLAEWSLHRELFAGELQNLDFPRVARESFGLDAVEYVSPFFSGREQSQTYLRQLRQRADDQGVRSLLIMVDGEGELGAAGADARELAVQNHVKWLDAALTLGCHSIRVNAAGPGSQSELRPRAAASLHALGELAEPFGLNVIVENHGGHSSDGAWLASVMRAADHDRVGTLPDFGNFHLGNGQWYDRYRGVEELMPFARAVSAKSHSFDSDGEEMNTDYSRMLRIVYDAGYRGYVGIEYEGNELPEREGIARTLALLERVRDELA
jgi:L-ribulose-5-phosphate 3-epimerase